MPVHKYADVIKAWADGQIIQYKYTDLWYPYGYPHMLPSWFNDREWRIKPTFLTLAQIAREAWYAKMPTNTRIVMRSGVELSDLPETWVNAAAAVKAAIESGEYS